MRKDAQKRYAQNPQVWIDRAADWQQKNAEKREAWFRAYYDAQAEIIRARARAWRRANPDRARLNEAKRRTRKTATAGLVDMAALWTGRCALCLEPLDAALLYPDPLSKSVDHIDPLSLGGTHTQNNLQWTHLICNIRKGNRID